MDNLLLNERLTKLYEDHWDKFCKEVKKSNICIGYPFLLSTCQWKGNLPTERWYTDSDLKVMVFGQEPNKWHGIDRCDDFNSTSQFYTGDKPETVGSIMSIYENFYATRYLPNCNKWYFDEKGQKNTFLVKGINNFMSQFDDIVHAFNPNLRTVCMWNNISKLSTIDGKPVDEHTHNIERKIFSEIIAQEIEILHPDIILFLTGRYDTYIKENLGLTDEDFIPFSEFSIHDVAKVTIPGVKFAYRTCHPNAYPKVKPDYYKYVEAIIYDIHSNLNNLLK
ncbi:hypothetical protein [Prevotella denticola]|uniref:hypothetical protein n=1 Tax=Prevotella denticola TaxID=28129 RepID=UPI0024200EC8|nr:hypothetical protein [Prevotella denticola]